MRANIAARKKAEADEAELVAMAEEVGAAALQYEDGRGPLQYKSSGEVGPFSETLHAIKMAPLVPGRYFQNLSIRLTGTDKVLDICIRGVAIDVPIFVKEPVGWRVGGRASGW